MKTSFFRRLFGAQTRPQIEPVYEPRPKPPRSFYDRLSEQRIAREERERQRIQFLPHGNYDTTAVAIQNAWVWLPGRSLEGQARAAEFVRLGWNRTHDPRLCVTPGVRRPLLQLETTSPAKYSIDPTERAVEILHAMLLKCPLLNADQDWRRTEVHLPVPNGVDEMVWFENVVAAWPANRLPAWGFHVSNQTPGQWLRDWLQRPTTTLNALCLSIDSRVNLAMNEQAPPNETLGEAVSLISLSRLPPPPPPPKNPAAPNDSTAEPVDIPGAPPSVHVDRLSVDVSPVASEWVRLALTTLTARAENDTTEKALHLIAKGSTHGWAIN